MSDYFSLIRQIKLGDRCPACGLPAGPRQFCPGCREDLLLRDFAGCRFCGTPVARIGQICGNCLQRTTAYDRFWFVQDYHGPLANMVRRLKYYQQLSLAPALGRLMVEPLQRTGLAGWPGRVAAMPMHFSRFRERGYNQAALLAKAVATHLNTDMAQPLVRRHPTPPLEGLSRKERRKAVSGAFECTQISGNWLLIDDVYTTGASVNAAAQALLDGGAGRVEVLCLARTPIKGDNHHNWLSRAFDDTLDAVDN